MTGWISLTYALRSLTRHTRRSILSAIGVGIGCSVAIFSASWVAGGRDMQIRAISESGGGHLRVIPAGWLDTRDHALRVPEWERIYARLVDAPGVRAAAPRIRANALLAMGNRSAAAEITGVRPQVERKSNRLVSRGEIEGRYIEPDDRGVAVIGKALSVRLGVGLDDDLYATLMGADGMHAAMLRVVGVLDIGSRDLESAFCHVVLEDLGEILERPGAGEISLLLERSDMMEAFHRDWDADLPAGAEMITWREINPGMATNIEGDAAFSRFIMGIIILVAALGIAGAQLAAVLERRKELAILSALGMKGSRIALLLLIEAAAIGVGGSVVATIVGGFGAYQLASHGVPLSLLMGEEASVALGDVMIDPYIYGDFGGWIVWFALIVCVASTVAASLYPAWLATRVNPADALRQ